MGVEATPILSQECTVSALSVAPYFPFRGVFPLSQVVRDEGDRAHSLIRFATDSSCPPCCSECGGLAEPVHSYHQRRIRDLNLAHATVELLVPYRKLRCPDCGIRIEIHDFLDPFRRSTRRFEQAVADLCQYLPVKQVAEHFGLSWHTVKEIDKRRLIQEVGMPCYDGLRLLAIDEISVHEGHRYMTSVLNFETGRIVWMGQDRTKKTMERFFAELSPQQLASIEAIALDMSGAYRQAVNDICPHVALVNDFFHVVAKYGREVVDRVRVDESKKQSEAGRRYIKGSRYLLLRNEENLSPDQGEQLQELLSVNQALSTVYVLKDQLKQLFAYRDPRWAHRALHQWCDLALASGLPPLERFATGLLNHTDGIVNHARHAIHTGVLEGIHSRIKVIKCQAYGFRDDHYLILKVKAAFPARLHPD